MRNEIRRLATLQDGVFGRWQLHRPGAFADDVDWAVRELRRLFPGVYVTGWGPITQRQVWRAATLTAPGTALQVASAAGLHGIRADPGVVTTVVRHGSRGANHCRGLRVAYSTTLDGWLTTVGGIPVTTVERTVIDLWPHLSAFEASRMLREALRIRATEPVALLAAIHGHRHRSGVRRLREELQARLHLPFHDCKSDPEALGLVILDAAGVEIPLVNEQIAGEEADFTWLAHRLIVEIDGPQWHRFKEEDARKSAIWTAAGFRVRRIPSDLVYADHSELLRLAPAPSRRPGRTTSILP